MALKMEGGTSYRMTEMTTRVPRRPSGGPKQERSLPKFP